MPNITIPVDLTNPGQFFACCGLLELADRLWPGAEAWFTPGATFSIVSEAVSCNLSAVLRALATATIEPLDRDDNASAIRLDLGKASILLDWWRDEAAGGQRLKTWAGRQSGPQIFKLMAKKIADIAAEDAGTSFDFSATVFDIKDGKTKKKTISPFYFDSRRAGTALDVGFSADEQQMSVREYPVVEALAMVGLQRCRPRVEESATRPTFAYTAWAEHLGASTVPSVVCGVVKFPSCGIYRFTRPSRGGEYVSMFTRATRERRSHV